jgi:UDP-N-acetylglucosamine acyltransferase
VSSIDPSAKIASGAVIGADVKIGPYCVIGPNVQIGDGCELFSHVHLTGHTTIGAGTQIYPFASLGTPPQSVHYKGEPTRLTIGAKCQIREHVTANTGTVSGGGVTAIGDNCMLMVGSHVAHDCHVGNNVIFANNAAIGGHVEVQDFVFLGGHCVVHQHTRLGESAMVAGYSAVREDVIPYGYVLYPAARLAGINVVGMRRRGVKRDGLAAVRAAYDTLFEGEGEFAARVDQVEAEHGSNPQVAQIIAFLRSAKRPVMMTKLRGQADDFE